MKVESLRIYIAGNNLITLNRYLGYDPETEVEHFLTGLILGSTHKRDQSWVVLTLNFKKMKRVIKNPYFLFPSFLH